MIVPIPTPRNFPSTLATLRGRPLKVTFEVDTSQLCEDGTQTTGLGWRCYATVDGVEVSAVGVHGFQALEHFIMRLNAHDSGK